MKQKIILTVLVMICFLLQSTVFQVFSLATIAPNLLIIITSSLGFMRGEKDGLYVGCLSGLLLDCFYGNLMGFYTLLYLFIGYGNGILHTRFYDEDVKLPMIWISLSELLYGLLVYFFLFLLREKFDFIYYLRTIIVPELIYTVLVTIISYRLLQKLSIWLEKLEDERIEEF